MIAIDETFKKSIGNRLKELRKQKAYTVDTLVGKCNKLYIDIDEKTIRRYEKGEFIPKIDNLIAFSEIYGVSLDYLIFGNETSDDNSYSWKDNLKRLNRLIFSCVLFPYKETDITSPYYDRYYFTSFDDEIKIYIEKLTSFLNQKNHEFEVYGKHLEFDIHDLDSQIDGFEHNNEQLCPTADRLNYLIKQMGHDPQEYLSNEIKEIQRKRKI